MSALSSARFVSTQGELAQALNKSRRTVIDYLDSGMRDACYTDYGYDLEAARLWVKQNVRKRADPEDSDVSPDDLRAAQYAKIKQEERKLRLKNDETEGRLVQADDVLQAIAERDLWIKTQLEEIPKRLEPQFPPEIRQQLKGDVEETIRLVLLAMANTPVMEIGDAADDSE